MKLPKYNGTIHPEEWLKQVQAYCYLKEIENEQKILKICKSMIDFTITIPNEINSFDELIKALKSHSTFNIFKNSCKEKLQIMKYEPKMDGVTFLANFRSLCAEIEDIREIKKFLFNAYSSNEFFKNEFMKRVNGINSVDKTVKTFSDIVFEESNVIRYGSPIALRHVSTGKYLSSHNIRYQTGSKRQVVFANKVLCNNPQALWFLKNNNHCLKEPYQQNFVFYGDSFYLKHKETYDVFGLSYEYKSPKTGQSEAFCCDQTDKRASCQFINLKSRNDNTLYVKSGDMINLKTIGAKNLILRSHDFTFTIDDKIFQEVVGHEDIIGANDEWCIELVEYNSVIDVDDFKIL